MKVLTNSYKIITEWVRCLIAKFVFRCERPNLLKNFVPTTIGEHIRKKRLESGWTREYVAERLEITVDRLFVWEKGGRVQIEHFPRIFAYLGYKPLQLDRLSPTDRLIAIRSLSRISQRCLAKKLGIMVEAIADFEFGKPIKESCRKKINNYLSIVT